MGVETSIHLNESSSCVTQDAAQPGDAPDAASARVIANPLAQPLEKTILSAALSPTWPYNALTVQVKITQNLRNNFWEVETRTGRSATSNLNPVLLSKFGPIVPKGR